MDNKKKSQFIEYFSKGIKNSNQLKIGVEHERFLFEGQNKKRVSYETLKRLFENLKKSEWSPVFDCLLYTSPSPRDATLSRMPSSA